MSTISLTELDTAIRQLLIQAASERRTVYYSELVEAADAPVARTLGSILQRITQYDIANNEPLLASIVIHRATGLPNEEFFEMCDTLDIDAYLTDLQSTCFEYWGKDIRSQSQTTK